MKDYSTRPTHLAKLVRALADNDSIADICDCLRAVCEVRREQFAESDDEQAAYRYETAAKDLADIAETMQEVPNGPHEA